jgi:hypothetical protein
MTTMNNRISIDPPKRMHDGENDSCGRYRRRWLGTVAPGR